MECWRQSAPVSTGLGSQRNAHGCASLLYSLRLSSTGDWSGDSEVKNTACPLKGPGLTSQHLYGDRQLSVALAPGCLIPSFGHFVYCTHVIHSHVCGQNIYTYYNSNTNSNNKIFSRVWIEHPDLCIGKNVK